MNTEMELMDWKEIESGALSAIRQSTKDMAIGQILLKAAESRIKASGGKTDAEYNKEQKKLSTNDPMGSMAN